MVYIELHGRICACRGTGWISAPGSGPKMRACNSPNVVLLSIDEWKSLGRPAVIEDCPQSFKEKREAA
jgi:hypothetical protein